MTLSDDRDALAQIIQEASNYHADAAYWEAGEIADAIIAAGWRAPDRWACGHERKVGNWGHNGECIQCTHPADYKAARGTVKLNRPAEQIIREERGR